MHNECDAKLKTTSLSKRETSELLDRLKATWPRGAIPKVKSIKAYEIDNGKRLLAADEVVVGTELGDTIIPFVGAQPELLSQFPSVTVDMGAVEFICKGAKVMRPGITNFGTFKKGDIVTIKDQLHGKVLGVGVALEASESAVTMSKGYVIENLHYVSDKMWQAFKEI